MGVSGECAVLVYVPRGVSEHHECMRAGDDGRALQGGIPGASVPSGGRLPGQAAIQAGDAGRDGLVQVPR